MPKPLKIIERILYVIITVVAIGSFITLISGSIYALVNIFRRDGE